VKPDRGNLTADVARALLELDFSPRDRQRVDELSAKARDGSLKKTERAELEEYIRVNDQFWRQVDSATRGSEVNGSGKKRRPKR
jgi:hypothetical protein